MATETLLVYGAGDNQVPVIVTGRRLGFNVIAIDRNPNARGARKANRFICLSLRDRDAIERALAGEPIDAVVARVTDPVALASARNIAATRGLAAPCPTLLAAATSKIALADFCSDAGLPTPRRIHAGERVDFTRESVLVRPDITVRGKAGIRRVSGARQFEEARQDAAHCSANEAVDVSTWIEGRDVSVLVHLEAGRARHLAMWDEWVEVDASGAIIGLGTGMPSRFGHRPELIDRIAARLAAALPESSGLITLSLRIDALDIANIIEIHLGVGGDAIADKLLPNARPGFDAFEALIRSAARQEFSLAPESDHASGLIRHRSGWKLVEAANVARVHDFARSAAPLAPSA